MAQRDPPSPNRLNQESIQPKHKLQSQADLIDPIKSRKPQRQPQQKPIKKKRKLLSFEDQEEQEPKLKIKKAAKQQTLKEGEGSSTLEEQLKKEFIQKSERVYFNQQQINEQLIELEYCYWDGPNVIKKLRKKKRVNILEYLQVCRIQIIQNFQNVASIQAKDLLFVIKDFIVPHDMTVADIQLLQLKTTKNDLLLNLRNIQHFRQILMEQPKSLKKCVMKKIKQVFRSATGIPQTQKISDYIAQCQAPQTSGIIK